MKRIIFLSVVLIMNTLFSSQNLTVSNDTARNIRIVYVHEKSPQRSWSEPMPDHIVVMPGRTRRLPHTLTNPKTIGLDVDGRLLADYHAIPLSDRSRSLIVHEYIPGFLALSQNGNIIAEVKVK